MADEEVCVLNTRTSWKIGLNDSLLFSKQETIGDVVDNFDYRRLYSAEGKTVLVDGVSESVIIQDHSNPLNEERTDKKIHVSMSSQIRRGSYVDYNGDKWLVTSGIDNVDDAYKSARIDVCNYTLNFLDSKGQPTSRPCIVENYTKYNSGTKTSGNEVTMELGSTQFYVKLPFDAETALLDRTYSDGVNRRLLLDFGTQEPRAYNITLPDRVTFNGLIALTLTEGLRSENDNIELMIADYHRFVPTPVEPEESNIAEILYSGSPVLYVGSGFKKFTATFKDEDGNTLSLTPSWNIIVDNSSLLQYVETETIENYIRIKVTNSLLLGTSIKLELEDADKTASSFIILEVTSLG